MEYVSGGSGAEPDPCCGDHCRLSKKRETGPGEYFLTETAQPSGPGHEGADGPIFHYPPSALDAGICCLPCGQILLLSGFLGVAFAWSVVLVTSTYSISGLYVQWRNDALSHGKFIRDVILQLIFVVDVISYVVFYFQIRRSCKEQGQEAEKTQGGKI